MAGSRIETLGLQVHVAPALHAVDAAGLDQHRFVTGEVQSSSITRCVGNRLSYAASGAVVAVMASWQAQKSCWV